MNTEDIVLQRIFDTCREMELPEGVVVSFAVATESGIGKAACAGIQPNRKPHGATNVPTIAVLLSVGKLHELLIQDLSR